MHVEVNAGAVEGNLHSLRQGYLHGTLHMEHGKETVVHQLVDNDNVGNRGTATHEQGNVRVSKNALHHNFILNLGQKLVRDVRVKDFFNGDWSAIEKALVNHRETSLTNLLRNLNIVHGDFTHTWHNW